MHRQIPLSQLLEAFEYDIPSWIEGMVGLRERRSQIELSSYKPYQLFELVPKRRGSGF